ncbi:putative rna splicing factor protein [Botrytis fragariae]|uniref:Putative rna splicing factor protein n=1 Tax=Botrytis fragariae TaxID=1964551 RepID=A0A8H6EP95_9HELO|nr:putative rna splicing factor protein [Botrytis fragariae]KAF5879419.1 putative rna splicing factor protein [Botrytis fragariae]
MSPSRTLPTLTQAEVASHNSADSCYVTMGTRVFDVTDFVDSHPGGGELVLEYAGQDVTAILKDELSHTHSEAAYDVLEDSFIGFVATNKVIDTATESTKPDSIVPLPPTKEGLEELKENGPANSLPVYANTGMSTEDDLNKETDVVNDYKTHKFLDLNKPLLMQIWRGGFSKEFYLEQVHRPRHYKGGESAPLFGNFLEPLSKTAWWVVPMVWVPPVTYGTYLASKGFNNIAGEAAYWFLGLFLWTLVEYILHRFLFHLDKWLPDNRVALTLHFLLHGIHHYLPMDKYRLVMPPTLFIVLATPFWKLAHTVFYWDWRVTTLTMSALDVEALLDSTAAATPVEPNGSTKTKESDDRHKGERSERRDRDRLRDDSRDRDRDRKRRARSRDRNEKDGTSTPTSEHGSAKGRRRSRSRDDNRRQPRRRRDTPEENGRRDGDYYRGGRGGGRQRSRTRSPDRYYRPRGDRRDRDDADKPREERRPRSPKREGTPPLTEDERDRRTVFVQQLAARLRTKELIAFFEKVGPVKEAQIVKDRVSGRSKGVGYVEFKNEESVPAAIQLTGQRLLGIPIIAQLTEAEKNRQVRNPEATTSNPNQIPFHRLYVGNIHFSITESDLQNVFEPFGELEFVQLQKEEQGRSRGYGFVQFRDPNQAREALEKMNGFDLAGRPIRVGLGNDKFTPESTASLLQRFHGQSHQQQFQGSAFSGAGGRGPTAAGGSNFDRAGGRDNDKGAGGASALDDTDVGGVNFNNYSRDALMRKLARTDDTTVAANHERREVSKPKTETKALPVNVNMASRCVVLKNMFDPTEEDGENWEKELEDDVRAEAEEKYGHVVHIALDPNSQGDIYLKFDRVQGGENAIKGLNGRYFGGRMISATPVVDAVYSSLFSRTKAM